MDLKERAEALWTRLVNVLREDGLIAHRIVQSGPATSALMVELVQQVDRPWLSMGIKPEADVQVLAQDDFGSYHIAWIDRYDGHWRTWHDEYTHRLQQWRYVS